jgi:hypothetical protein
MTLAELTAEANRLTRNTSVDALWTDAEWANFANWAEQEACRRANLIWDRATVNVARYSLAIGAAWTDMSAKLIEIERVTFAGVSLPYIALEILDQTFPGWEALTDTPVFVTKQGRALRLYPKPKVAGDLIVHASRLPSANLAVATPSGSPEIPAHLHLALVDGMLHRAYLKNDSETYNKGASDHHLAEFERTFGLPIDVNRLYMPGERSNELEQRQKNARAEAYRQGRAS